MHITHIELQNFKTIKEFVHSFNGGVYLLTGENEVGKSTILNAIATLLTGGRSDNLLKLGEEKGFAKMTVADDNGGYDVELRFTEKNPRGTITIKKQGSGLSSNNISALQEIFQYQDFDAHEFVMWGETAEGRRKQVEAVKGLLPKEVQERIAEIDNKTLEAKQLRKEANLEVKSLTTLLDNSGVLPEDLETYKEPLVVAELIEEKTKALQHNNSIERAKEELAVIEQNIEALPGKKDEELKAYDGEIDEVNAEIERLKNKLEKLEADKKGVHDRFADQMKREQSRKKEADAWFKKNKPVDVAAIDEKLTKAEGHNEKHQAVKAYKSNRELVDKYVDNVNKLQGQIDKMAEERKELIEAHKLPVAGLDFGEDGLTLHGVPFRAGEVSTSQEMEVAAKLIIAKNPNVKVFRIAQGESLGSKRLKAIAEFAKTNGYQGFIEEVKRGQDELRVEEYIIN